MNLEYEIVSETGLREDMEDRYCLVTPFYEKCGELFTGVFDGHSGTYAAHLAATEIPRLFLEKIRTNRSVRKAFIESFQTVSGNVAQAMSKSGACATTLFIRPQTVFFANTGDCGLCALREGRLQMLTNQHRVGNPIEEERVRHCGGYISKGYVWVGDDGLQPLRTIGDTAFKRVGVIAEPECGSIRITKPIVLLLGTDGLFDVVSNDAIRRILSSNRNPRAICEQLRDAVEKARPIDNYTFIALSVFP